MHPARALATHYRENPLFDRHGESRYIAVTPHSIA
jgi:hypothetical protein